MNTREAGGGKENQVDVSKMRGAQDRIDYFRGKVPDYSHRVEWGFERIMGTIDLSAKDREKIFHAFQSRVEDNLHAPGGPYGGGALDHLPQIGVSLITEEQYEALQREALAVAGSIMDDSGHKSYATSAWAKLGRMTAVKESK